MPIFNPPTCPPSGFNHAYAISLGTTTVTPANANIQAGNTPYDKTVSGTPPLSGGSGAIVIGQVIAIGVISGTASSVGDTVTIILNGVTIYSQSISPSSGWSVNVDDIYSTGTATIEVIAMPTNGTQIDGTVNPSTVVIYPGSIIYTADNLTEGEAFGITILGNSPILPISNNYDWDYGFGSFGTVPTSAWNNTDPNNMEVSTDGGLVSILMIAVTGGSTNLYPNAISVGYILGA